MWRRTLTCLLLSLMAMPVGSASAADSHAPAGARDDWLPNSTWVMSSWLPYDEARLERLLGSSREELSHWLDDRRSLAELAAARGYSSPRALATRLVATRDVSSRTRRVLYVRALDTLTQPHLARHVLFHIFHTPAIPDRARAVFGVSPSVFRSLRDAGRSPNAIAEAGGRTQPELRQALDRLLAQRVRDGVRTGAMSAAQAEHLLTLQRESLPLYVGRPFRTPAAQALFACSLHEY